MTMVTVAERKARASEMLRKAEAGEEVVVTRRNHPVVRLEPIAAPPNRTRLSFAPAVEIHADITGPVLEPEEWGDLAAP